MNASTSTSGQQVRDVSIQDQARDVVMPLAAGYVGYRTVTMGMRHGLLQTLTAAPDGMTADELADAHGFDPFYTAVWCQAALGVASATSARSPSTPRTPSRTAGLRARNPKRRRKVVTWIAGGSQ